MGDRKSINGARGRSSEEGRGCSDQISGLARRKQVRTTVLKGGSRALSRVSHLFAFPPERSRSLMAESGTRSGRTLRPSLALALLLALVLGALARAAEGSRPLWVMTSETLL